MAIDISKLTAVQTASCEQAGRKAIDAFLLDEEREYWFNYTCEGCSEQFLKNLMLGLGCQIVIGKKRPDARFCMDFVKYFAKNFMHRAEEAPVAALIH